MLSPVNVPPEIVAVLALYTGIATLAGLLEVAAGDGQLSVIVILYCDLAAGKGAAIDGQLGLIPACAGLGLTIGAIFRCGAVLPAIADQAGIEAELLSENFTVTPSLMVMVPKFFNTYQLLLPLASLPVLAS